MYIITCMFSYIFSNNKIKNYCLFNPFPNFLSFVEHYEPLYSNIYFISNKIVIFSFLAKKRKKLICWNVYILNSTRFQTTSVTFK